MIKKSNHKNLRERRHTKVRGKVSGTSTRPRVAIFRSLRSLSAQLIDDGAEKTLAAVRLAEVKKAKRDVEGAKALGMLLGEKAKKLGIEEAVFDRAGYKYHGQVKAFADGLRAAGIKM